MRMREFNTYMLKLGNVRALDVDQRWVHLYDAAFDQVLHLQTQGQSVICHTGVDLVVLTPRW